jgi:sec-independent protein translocase protein TatB
MFDLAWSELALIGLVAVLVLGPKELPGAMRTVAKMMRKMRGLTSELQGHMNEIVREAELEEVRNSIQKLSTTNLKAEVVKLTDPTGEIASTLNQPVLPVDPPATTAQLSPEMHTAPEPTHGDEPVKPAAPT